jgi:hypothetical protein
MDLQQSMKRRGTVSSDQARGIIQSIPALKNMFEKYPDYKGDLFGDFDNSQGILYLSRLNTVEHRPTTNDDDDRDGEVDLGYIENLEETKSTSTVAMSASTRDKKRQFAMSLSTLAMKPHKREVIVEEGAVSSLNDLSLIDDVIIRRFAPPLPLLSSHPPQILRISIQLPELRASGKVPNDRPRSVHRHHRPLHHLQPLRQGSLLPGTL